MWTYFRQFFMVLGKWLLLSIAKYWTNNIAIWSHWLHVSTWKSHPLSLSHSQSLSLSLSFFHGSVYVCVCVSVFAHVWAVTRGPVHRCLAQSRCFSSVFSSRSEFQVSRVNAEWRNTAVENKIKNAKIFEVSNLKCLKVLLAKASFNWRTQQSENWTVCPFMPNLIDNFPEFKLKRKIDALFCDWQKTLNFEFSFVRESATWDLLTVSTGDTSLFIQKLHFFTIVVVVAHLVVVVVAASHVLNGNVTKLLYPRIGPSMRWWRLLLRSRMSFGSKERERFDLEAWVMPLKVIPRQWPDLAKFRHFGKILQYLANFEVYLVFGENINVL